MSVIYKKIQQIVGPLLFLKNEHDAQYGEIVKIKTDNNKILTGQVVKMSEDAIVVEVFEDTKGLSSENAEIIFTEDTFKVNISKDMFGQTFNSLGKPFDIKTKLISESDILTDV
ncbi:MAG: V-type ATP synthase subunit B, partial [Promethearchaeota archaeon]